MWDFENVGAPKTMRNFWTASPLEILHFWNGKNHTDKNDFEQ